LKINEIMEASSSIVDFTPSSFTAHDIRYEIPALLTNPSVKVLHLPTDRLDEASIKCILMMLLRDDVGPCIEELRLSHVPIRGENSDRDGRKHSKSPFTQIVSSLKQSTGIKKLTITDTTFNANDTSAVSSILYDIKSLRSLVLRQCGIDYKAASKIACALASNTSVQLFDFSNNPIGNRGVSALAVALEINTSIKKLKLSGTHLGIEGAVAIASVITNNSTLEVLDLSRNSIGDMGSSKIAIALKSNKSVRQLSLRQNFLSDIGAMCISLSLYDNKNLQTILGCNHSIRYLNLCNNEVGKKCMLDIETARRMNLHESEKETIRQKVAFFLNNPSNTSYFGNSMTVECMPYLLSAISNTENITSLYNVVKYVNMPELFEPKSCTGCADSIFSNETDTPSASDKNIAIPAIVQVDDCEPSSALSMN